MTGTTAERATRERGRIWRAIDERLGVLIASAVAGAFLLLGADRFLGDTPTRRA